MDSLTKDVIRKIEEVYDLQVDTNNIVLCIKADNTARIIKELRPLVNKEFYNIFKHGIDNSKSLVLKESDLKRLSGKTSTMVLLALEYDLPLVVSTNLRAGNLRKAYANTFLRVYSSSGDDLITGDTVLFDGGSIGDTKQVSTGRTFIGFKE